MIACRACKVEKSEDEFHRHTSTKNGRHPDCKECRKAERRNAYARKRDTALTQMRAYYVTNGDVIRQRAREDKQLRRQDPEYVKRESAFNREWRRRNPEKVAASNARQRARGRFSPDWTVEEWTALLDLYGHRCLACLKTGLKLQPDHVVPLSWPDASNAIDNIQPLCGTCNRRKGDRHIDYRPQYEEAQPCP
ncbi:HNH endonuclease signature motif containing protein [Streptomyces sp. NPDC058232]|uniref:HNH endonuclease signature motif containing protein n=1 Tax=Streptomyces sp. NPDC058232 TaxID=3346393 RepID=UPI0036EE3966